MSDKKTKKYHKTKSEAYLTRVLFGVIFFSGFLMWQNAEAATYYVKNGGNDSLAGTSDETAWATISKVTSTVTSGDTVYFRSQDTWTGANTLLNAVAGVTYDGATYGTGTRATFQVTSRTVSYGVVQIYVSNVTFKGFKVDGNKLSIGGIYIGGTDPTPSGDIANITVDNCEVTNGITTDNPDPSYYYSILVGARGSHTTSNVTVTNNIVHDVGHEGIAVYPNWGGGGGNRVNGALIRGNTVYNTGQVSSNRQTAIDLVNDADNIVVEYNYTAGAHVMVANYGYAVEYPDNFTIRYNIFNGTSVGLNGYFNFPHFYGNGSIYGNLIWHAGISFGGFDYHSQPIKIYNNTVVTDYAGGHGSYALDIGLYYTPMNATGIELKNNIFIGTGLNVVRTPSSALGSVSGIVHTNNLFYRTDSSSNVVFGAVLNNANAVPATSVSVTHDGTYTYFTKSGGTDWTTVFSVGNHVKWDGFVNAEFNGRLFEVQSRSADQITVYNVKGGSVTPTETAVVTGEKWVAKAYSSSEVQSLLEPSCQNTNPAFTGGTFPTGFSGTYGTNMVPNTDYFQLTNDSPAKDNGATLGSPFNGSINGAGLATPFLRPQGAAYDIGAYELTDSVSEDIVPPAAPSGLSVQ